MPSCEDCKRINRESGDEPYDHRFQWICEKRPGMANLKSFPFATAPQRCFEAMKARCLVKIAEVEHCNSVICPHCVGRAVGNICCLVEGPDGEELLVNNDGFEIPEWCPLEDLAAHDAAVREDERRKMLDVNTKFLEASQFTHAEFRHPKDVDRINVLEKERDALLAERFTVRVAAIDELMTQYVAATGGADSDLCAIAKRLKEA